MSADDNDKRDVLTAALVAVAELMRALTAMRASEQAKAEQERQDAVEKKKVKKPHGRADDGGKTENEE